MSALAKENDEPRLCTSEMYTTNHLLFCLERSILSSPHPVEFHWKGHQFKSADEAIGWAKVAVFEGEDKANDQLQNQIIQVAPTGFDEVIWRENAERIWLSILLAKFSQSETSKSILFSSGKRKLAAASITDNEMGIGLHLDDPDVRFSEKWPGQNEMGRMLDKVKGELEKYPSKVFGFADDLPRDLKGLGYTVS